MDNVGGPTGTGAQSKIAVVAGMRHKFQGGFQADSHRIAGMTGGTADAIHPVAKGSAACRRGLLCIGEGQFLRISLTLCV
ncbi:porin [Pandoraea communis]|uniref:Porin n=1 Tax=Pandoraea communis TaxID=2508297 RepID=A0A5E4YMH7_9BURK|nr:porin [Pandoraea communis]